MMDSEQVHQALNDLGYRIEPGKAEPSYAYEHYLGANRYLYVKRKENQAVHKDPLVLHPDCITLRSEIDAINGLSVVWLPTKSTSYRRFPRSDGASQYGFGASVEKISALEQLVALLTDQSPQSELLDQPAELQNQEFPMQPLNQILYGPPGTGKTYVTTELAVKIAEPSWYASTVAELSGHALREAVKQKYDELVSSSRIMFTTFHQSFSYEDFIEGIRATKTSDGVLAYAIEPGLFKQLCQNADRRILQQQEVADLGTLNKRNVWKMSLGNSQTGEAEEVFSDCRANNYVLLGWGGTIDFSGCDNLDAVKDRYQRFEPREEREYAFSSVNTFKNQIDQGDLIVISDGNSRFQAIAEVVGDYRRLDDSEERTFYQARDVRWLKVYEKSRPVSEIYTSNFMQKAIYGLQDQKLKWDALAEMLSVRSDNLEQSKPYVLIIDEINRGNISRIFGELITLLEPSKRQGMPDAQSVVLPYSKERFSVPSNVYVIGTMNTADRSLAQLDLALRRRFSFIEMLPQPQLLAGISVCGVDLGQLLNTINQRIEVLIDAEHQIGHSYFIGLKDIKGEEDRRQELSRIFRERVIPLLKEYFFDDFERIGWVLNDSVKQPEHRFVILMSEKGASSLNHLFPNEISERLTDRRYRINTQAFDCVEAYQGIVQASA